MKDGSPELEHDESIFNREVVLGMGATGWGVLSAGLPNLEVVATFSSRGATLCADRCDRGYNPRFLLLPPAAVHSFAGSRLNKNLACAVFLLASILLLSIYLYIYPSIYLSFYLSKKASMYTSVFLPFTTYLSIYLYIYLSIYLCGNRSIHLTFSFNPSMSLPAYLSIFRVPPLLFLRLSRRSCRSAYAELHSWRKSRDFLTLAVKVHGDEPRKDSQNYFFCFREE